MRNTKKLLLIPILIVFLSIIIIAFLLKENGILDDPDDNYDDDNKQEYVVTYDFYYHNTKLDQKILMVEIDYEKASNGTANKITVVNNKNYRVVFILENDKVVSRNNAYTFTMENNHHFDIYITDIDKVNIVLLADDDTFQGLLYFEINTPFTLEKSLPLLDFIDIPENMDFLEWDQELPDILTNDLFLKAHFTYLDEFIDVKIVLDKKYQLINNEAIFKASIETSEKLTILRQGFIVLESEYFVDELTIENIFADIIEVAQNNQMTINISQEKLDKINIRAYVTVQTISGRTITIYSDDIYIPFVYTDDLIFSGYLEYNKNKAIAIFNGTGREINLNKYAIKIYYNGNTTPTTTIALKGTLPHNTTYVIVPNSLSYDNIKNLINMNKIYGEINNSLNHNGNDCLELVYESNVIDRIGTIGDDRYFGEDIALIRKSNIISGNTTNWTKDNPFSFNNAEWDEINFNTNYDQFLNHRIAKLGYEYNYNYLMKEEVINKLFYLKTHLLKYPVINDLDFLSNVLQYPNVYLKWTSSKPDLIENGKYLFPKEDAIVEVGLQIYINGEPQNYFDTFEITVGKSKITPIFDVNFSNGLPNNWETTSNEYNTFYPGDTLTSEIFTISSPSRLIINSNSSNGKCNIILYIDNEILDSIPINLQKEYHNYLLTIDNLEVNKIVFEFIDGPITLNFIRLASDPNSLEVDYEPPIIFANIPTRIPVGTTIDLESCYAIDNVDGKMSCSIIENNLDISKAGTYNIIFYASDSSNNEATLELIITVFQPDTYKRLEYNPTEVLVKFIDLGKYYTNDGEKGESIFIKIGEIDILVDVGMPNRNTHKALDDILANYLTGKLDYIIATHPDQDHIGGFAYVLENYEVDMAIIYSTTHHQKSTLELRFLEALSNEPGLDVCEIKDNIEGNLQKNYCLEKYNLAPSITITFIDTTFYNSDKTNESSIVFVLEAFGTKILLNGDAEEKQELVYAPKVGNVNILKLGHHGTRNATSEFLLSYLNPEIVIVSHGVMLGNGHGHPTFETINRIYQFNSNIKIYTPAGGGSKEDNCRIIGPSYKCEANNLSYQRNGTITVTITQSNYIITSENYGQSPIEFSSLTFWQNHPERKYSHISK
ncbi:MAG: MBL fold metallo-hydrolase [Acholeplasmataceae bacterium]|nr:MBL fold metallo-hydrolase [Acholeplasmataceae bacterium]